MKELDIINNIKAALSKNSHIGDDCAYLKELEIVITQDSLVEDVHFSMKYSTPYQLGYKAIMVNISDIYASGAIPKYLTISLSLPAEIDETFIKDFYTACNDLSNEYNFEIVGGDITGGEKIFISVCAIGETSGRNISSRKNAHVGDYVIASGNHGSSAAGLWLLQNENNSYPELIEAHLKPKAQKELSEAISKLANGQYAMMDTSDGLADALFKIAQSSNVQIEVDFSNIPYDKSLIKVAQSAQIDPLDWILYGGEDYQIIACVNEDTLNKIDKNLYKIIGKVNQKNDNLVQINLKDKKIYINDLEKTYNHFKKL